MQLSIKTLAYFLIVIVFVASTLFMLQGMLPSANKSISRTGDDNTDLDKTIDKDIRVRKLQPDSKVQGKMADDTPNIKQVNFQEKSLPEDVIKMAKNVKVDEKKIEIQKRNMFYRESQPVEGLTPTYQNALLLHGMNFKSETWLKTINTMNLLAAMGHRVVAFDLPGYGETGGDQLADEDKGSFLNEAIEKLKLDNPIIVSPSMSGSYSLPYLFNYPNKMGGYVPVAPIYTQKYSKEQYQTIKTPTLIVYGELDSQLGDVSTSNLKNIPNSQVVMLEKAKHPAYLDQPDIFHQLLYNFFLELKVKQNLHYH